jgi:tRNA dimethylallyltransferase
MNEQTPILVVMGPTAVGKTSFAIEQALRVGGEIISADSRQVYIEINIGTAKPSPDELAAVPHHFINELHLDEPFSAGKFAELAENRIADILERGRTPIVCGGSTLYLNALMFGLAAIPEIEDSVRQKVMQDLENQGSEALYAQLQRIDPVFASTLDHTKTQRLVRGLEVYEGTGAPLSSFHAAQLPPRFRYQPVVLLRERSELYDRINIRVDQMLKDGLIYEVRQLLADGFSPDLNPLRTIGYQEPIAFLEDKIDEAEMIRLLKRNSRRYAKRQMTWFRALDAEVRMLG